MCYCFRRFASPSIEAAMSDAILSPPIKNERGRFFGRRAEVLTLVVVTIVALAIVIAPVLIIQPFKPQTARGLQLSFNLRLWSPLITLLSFAAGLFLVASLWSGTRRWWKKALLIAILIPLLAAAWFARQNHFEWMFNPLASAGYVKNSDARFVEDSDIVLAVVNNGEAAAYPIRQMAYHHLVQDVVGGTPIVATY
jgi:hypothetical protein